MVLSVSALGQLADTIAENSRTTVSFTTEPPEKRCIPYYDRRFNLTGNPLYANSKFLFDARQGDYITRVCTNADKSVVDIAMGAEYFVDTLNSSTSGACSLASNADKILAAANCVPASSDVNCTDAFQIGSTQLYAVMWNYAVSSLTEEQKQSSTVYGPCAVNVRRLPEVVGNKCTLANVYGYTFTNQNMTTLIALSAVCLVVRVVIELLGVHAFHKELNGESKENSENPMFFKVAVDGTFGKVYLAWLWLKAGCSADAFNALPAPQEWQMKDFLLIQVCINCNCEWPRVSRNARHAIYNFSIGTHFINIFRSHFLSLMHAQGMDAISNIVVPIANVWGCPIGKWYWFTALVLFGGIIKAVGMTAYQIYSQCKVEAEKGETKKADETQMESRA